MTETAGAVQNGFVLRMSMPASGEIGALGPALGVKLAEQLGLAKAGAAAVGHAMADLARGVDPSGTRDISFVFHKDGNQLKIEARHGDASRSAVMPLNP